jgi:hypothetical protein
VIRLGHFDESMLTAGQYTQQSSKWLGSSPGLAGACLHFSGADAGLYQSLVFQGPSAAWPHEFFTISLQ